MTEQLPAINSLTPRRVLTLDIPGNRVMQSFSKDPVTGDFYVTQVGTVEPDYDLMVYHCTPQGKVVDHAILKGGGHGTTLGLERDGGNVYLWIWWLNDTTGSGVTTARWKYKGSSQGLVVYADDSSVQPMTDFDAGNPRTWVAYAVDQETDRIASLTRYQGNETIVLRKLSEAKAGTDNVLATIGPYSQSGLGACQGFATTDEQVFVHRGGTDAGWDLRLHQYDWSSGADAVLDVTSYGYVNGVESGEHNEAEGVCIWRDRNGVPALLFGIVNGPLHQRVNNVFSLAKQPVMDSGFRHVALDVQDITGAPLVDAEVSLTYDRTVRKTTGGIVPPPAATPITVTADGDVPTVQVMCSDDPNLTDDSFGFGMRVTIRWSQAPDWRRIAKTYTAQVLTSDDPVVALSQIVGAQIAPMPLTGIKQVFEAAAKAGIRGPIGPPGADGAVSDAGLAGLLVNGSSQSHAALLSAVRARTNPYQRLATDFGIDLDSTADQTTKMQAALNACAQDGADLLLQGRIICEGPLSWKSRHHRIIGMNGAVLDFSQSTTAGPSLTVDGTWLDSAPKDDMMVQPQLLQNILVLGPSSSSTTVDGIKIGTDDFDERNPGVTLDQVAFRGFRHQEILANQQWLTFHRGCGYRKAAGHAVYIEGGNNAGEGLRWSDSVFYGTLSDAAVYIDKTANSDVHFAGGAFDYNVGSSIECHSGLVTLEQVHFETSSANSAWVPGHNPPFVKLVSEASSSHALVLSMNGCQVMLHGEIAENSADVFPMIETVTTDATPPPVVSINGNYFAQAVTNRWHGGALSILEETGAATAQSLPLVTFSGNNYGYTGGRYATFRPGTLANTLADSGFSGLTAGTITYTSGLGTGWVVDSEEASNVTIDSSKTAPTGQAVKASYPSGAPSKPLIAQTTTGMGGQRFITSTWVWMDPDMTPGNLFRTEMTWYDAEGNLLGTYPGARLDATGKTAQWRGHWIHTYYLSNRPPGGFYGQVRLNLDGTTGTLWLSDLQLAAIS